MESDKWMYSHDEEYYYGDFDTKEEAIAEGLDGYESCSVALFKPAKLEEYLFASDIFERIREHDDFSHDAYDDMFNCSKEQRDDLEALLRTVLREWAEKNLRPVRLMDVDTLEEVSQPDTDSQEL